MSDVLLNYKAMASMWLINSGMWSAQDFKSKKKKNSKKTKERKGGKMQEKQETVLGLNWNCAQTEKKNLKSHIPTCVWQTTLKINTIDKHTRTKKKKEIGGVMKITWTSHNSVSKLTAPHDSCLFLFKLLYLWKNQTHINVQLWTLHYDSHNN